MEASKRWIFYQAAAGWVLWPQARDTCVAHTHPVRSATPLTTSRLSRNAEDWVARRL